jgi:isoleucyl-tRNA synthetase
VPDAAGLAGGTGRPAGRAAYRNVLVNDLVQDRDGKKMSKTRGNTVDPFALFDRFGADVVRWYLLSASPAWSPTRFDEEGLVDVAGGFFGTLRNVYKFFVLYANQDGIDPQALDMSGVARPEADRWLLSRLANLIGATREEMDRYDHMRATRGIQRFVVEDLSNWHIRRARRRFWGAELTDDKKSVYATTWEALVAVAQLIAPFAPFLADEIYGNLAGGAEADSRSGMNPGAGDGSAPGALGMGAPGSGGSGTKGSVLRADRSGARPSAARSVHLTDFPEARDADRDAALEEKMDLVRGIVSLGRGVREKERLKVRQPLQSVLVDGKLESLVGGMTDLIEEELNIKQVVFAADVGAYMDYALKPDFKAAGPVFGPKVKAFAAALGALKGADAAAFVSGLGAPSAAMLTVDGEEIAVTADLVDVKIGAKEGFAVAAEGGIFVILDTTLTPALLQEGLAREFVSKIQQMRKAEKLEMMDRIEVFYEGDEDVVAMVRANAAYIMRETLADGVTRAASAGQDDIDLNGHAAKLGIRKNG